MSDNDVQRYNVLHEFNDRRDVAMITPPFGSRNTRVTVRNAEPPYTDITFGFAIHHVPIDTLLVFPVLPPNSEWCPIIADITVVPLITR